MPPVRLKDVAARAGVSMMTVSKVMHNAPDISPATKTRVKLIAQQMGYVPNVLAQNLRARRTKFIGLLVPSITNPALARTTAAIEEHAHELGHEVILAQTLNIPEREDSKILRLISRRVDGLIISPVYRPAEQVRAFDNLADSGIPTVILGHRPPFCRHFVNVEGDDIAGSEAVTQHLLKLGHRRIAFLAGPLLAPWAQQRLEGYRRALRQADIEVEDCLIFQAGSTIEDGAKAAEQLLEESCDATAIQAATDFTAIGCADRLLSHGIKIPANLSIAGYGNIPGSEFFRVPLTTVRCAESQLGAAAMDLLIRMLQGEKPDSIQLPAELLIRASTAPPGQTQT